MRQKCESKGVNLKAFFMLCTDCGTYKMILYESKLPRNRQMHIKSTFTKEHIVPFTVASKLLGKLLGKRLSSNFFVPIVKTSFLIIKLWQNKSA